jgi:hypothetical protein
MYRTGKPEDLFYEVVKIVNWKRLHGLQNTDPNSVLSSVIVKANEDGTESRIPRIQLAFGLEGDSGPLAAEEVGDGKFRLVVTDSNDLSELRSEDKERWYGFQSFNIDVQGPTPPLHFYLFTLYSTFQIYGLKIDPTDSKLLNGQQTSRTFDFPEAYRAWGLGTDELKDSITFKLIVTEDPLENIEKLTQGPIPTSEDERAGPKTLDTSAVFKDWAVITLDVELIRAEAITEREERTLDPATPLIDPVTPSPNVPLPTLTLQGHDGPIRALAFSPNGRYILTGSNDKTAKLWTLDGRELQTFSGHTGPVISVAFSPDGRSFMTGSKDNTAKLWKMPDADS